VVPPETCRAVSR